MDPFISVFEFSNLDPSEYTLIQCVLPNYPVKYHIDHSHLFRIPDVYEEFVEAIRKLDLDYEKRIVCYDSGDMRVASRVFWGLRAAGFDEVQVLVGGLHSAGELGLEIEEGPSSEIVSTTSPFLPFNYTTVLSYSELIRKDSFFQQVIHVNGIAIRLDDISGLREPSEIKNDFDKLGISYRPGSALIIHGRDSALCGMMIRYLGEKAISVVFESSSKGFTISKERSSTIDSGYFSASDTAFFDADTPHSGNLSYRSSLRSTPGEEQRGCCCLLF